MLSTPSVTETDANKLTKNSPYLACMLGEKIHNLKRGQSKSNMFI